MSDLLVIDVWQKGTNQYTSMPDYHIEVKSGEIDYVWDLISALKGIALRSREVEEDEEESK
jgi:hypothetical protein